MATSRCARVCICDAINAWPDTLRIWQVITGEEVADEYGVNKSSYDPVLLPNIKAYTVTVKQLGAPADVLDLGTEAVPKELEWGEVR